MLVANGQTAEDLAVDMAMINRIVARDDGAVADLYDRHGRLVFGLIVRILRERSEAEDVLQEVFLTVWSKAATYKAELGSPLAWLVRIARNRSIDRLRGRGVRERGEQAMAVPLPSETPELAASRSEAERTVKRALDLLPTEQRTLIEEAYFGGLTHADLAARFGLPLGTVKTRVRTGMIALRERLSGNE